jgi:hypothetical protein
MGDVGSTSAAHARLCSHRFKGSRGVMTVTRRSPAYPYSLQQTRRSVEQEEVKMNENRVVTTSEIDIVLTVKATVAALVLGASATIIVLSGVIAGGLLQVT